MGLRCRCLHLPFTDYLILEKRFCCQKYGIVASLPKSFFLKNSACCTNTWFASCALPPSKKQPMRLVQNSYLLLGGRNASSTLMIGRQTGQSMNSYGGYRNPLSNCWIAPAAARRRGRPMEATAAVTMLAAFEFPKDEYFVHTVRWGETLHSIAKKYAVPVEEIVEVNHISDLNCILDKTRLRIPGSPVMGTIRVSDTNPVETFMLRRSGVERKKGTRTRKKRDSSRSQAVVETLRPSAAQLGLQVAAAGGIMVGALAFGIGLSLAWAKVRLVMGGGRAHIEEHQRARGRRFGKSELLGRMQGALVDDRLALIKSAQGLSDTAAPQERVLAPVASDVDYSDGGEIDTSNEDELDELRRVDRPYEETLRSYDQMQTQYQQFLQAARVGRKGILERNRKSPTQRL